MRGNLLRPSEEDDQLEDGEAEDMAQAVDPAAAAPEGYGSDYSDAFSTLTDVTYDTDTPIDPRYILTEDMEISPKDGSPIALDLHFG
eukprot:498554-Pyramimonas_sp.AAC.1